MYRAKCCNPIRGEAIVGYVTRGKGVAVHSKMCPNVQNLMYDVERKIEVEWARAAEDAFPVRIMVHTDDRPGMLNQLTSVLSDENTNIRSLEAKTELDHDGGMVEMTVDVRDKKQLEKLVSAMRRISGVRDVERLIQLNMTISHRPRTHRHLQIEGHQDRLERRPPQRVRPRLPARQVPLRGLHRRARHAAAPAASGQPTPFPDVQAGAEDAARGAGGQLRHPHQLERRPQFRHLLLRAFPRDLPVRGMHRLPLTALLSQALVAFIIEFDNEFEHRMPHRTSDFGATPGAAHAPWLVSMAMWAKFLRYVPEDGIAAGELQRLVGIDNQGMKQWLTRLGKWWGYLAIEKGAAGMLIRPTAAGRQALAIWRPLEAIVEDRWEERFGKEAIRRLRESLRAVAVRLDAGLPDFLPILGYGLYSKTASAGTGPKASGLAALLSRVLLAWASSSNAKPRYRWPSPPTSSAWRTMRECACAICRASPECRKRPSPWP